MYELKKYYTYILASKPNGILYIGFSGDLVYRMHQHVNEDYDGFTKKYHVKQLVYFEIFEDPSEGIKREKSLKKWRRKWKIKLIQKYNPKWTNLFVDGEILPLPVERSF
jgi:putative endonuclease